jgi:hypothetical protein
LARIAEAKLAWCKLGAAQELGRFAIPLGNVSEGALLRIPFPGGARAASRIATGSGRKPDCQVNRLSSLEQQASPPSCREITAPISGVAKKENATQRPRTSKMVIVIPGGRITRLKAIFARQWLRLAHRREIFRLPQFGRISRSRSGEVECSGSDQLIPFDIA